jgi:hypothetical protein
MDARKMSLLGENPRTAKLVHPRGLQMALRLASFFNEETKHDGNPPPPPFDSLLSLLANPFSM